MVVVMCHAEAIHKLSIIIHFYLSVPTMYSYVFDTSLLISTPEGIMQLKYYFIISGY
jgi:hypothetical protein